MNGRKKSQINTSSFYTNYFFDMLPLAAVMLLLTVIVFGFELKGALLLIGSIIIPLFVAGVTVAHLVANELRDYFSDDEGLVSNWKTYTAIIFMLIMVFVIVLILYKTFIYIPFGGS